MTSGRLIELIKEADPGGKRQVILAGDQECNFYNDCYGVRTAAQNKRGDVGIEKLTPEDEEDGYRPQDIIKGRKVLVIDAA